MIGADRNPLGNADFRREISRVYLFDAGSTFGAFSHVGSAEILGITIPPSLLALADEVIE